MARVTEDVLFGVGHIVHHVRYGYRGVVVGYDTTCQADNDWYVFQIQGKGYKPTRQQPWYHVLVDDSTGRPKAAFQAAGHRDAWRRLPSGAGRPVRSFALTIRVRAQFSCVRSGSPAS